MRNALVIFLVLMFSTSAVALEQNLVDLHKNAAKLEQQGMFELSCKGPEGSVTQQGVQDVSPGPPRIEPRNAQAVHRLSSICRSEGKFCSLIKERG